MFKNTFDIFTFSVLKHLIFSAHNKWCSYNLYVQQTKH